MPNDFTGSCHCGAIGFTFRTSIELPDWSIRACQCSFCRAHDAQSTSDPAGQISFIASRLESLQKYRFGYTPVASFKHSYVRQTSCYAGNVASTLERSLLRPATPSALSTCARSRRLPTISPILRRSVMTLKMSMAGYRVVRNAGPRLLKFPKIASETTRQLPEYRSIPPS